MDKQTEPKKPEPGVGPEKGLKHFGVTPDPEDTEAQGLRVPATPDADDTEGQTVRRLAIPDADDTEGQLVKRAIPDADEDKPGPRDLGRRA
jgi:hypothetical protein